jgi:hypothetical protein
MSFQQIRSELYNSPDHPDDGLIPSTADLLQPPQEKSITAAKIDETNPFIGVSLDISPLTYDERIAAGKSAVARAIDIEEVYGIEAAADSYLEAKHQFIGAIGVQKPEGENPLREEPTDPTILLQLGTCFSKLVKTSYAQIPYERKQSKWYKREEIWKQSAEKSLKEASRVMLGEVGKNIDEETIVSTAVIAAEGLKDVGAWGASQRLLSETSIKLRSTGGDDEFIEFIDRQATQYGEGSAKARHEAASTALLDLATGSHEILSLV